MTAQIADFVVLAILDGWGIATASPGNAITLAETVNFNRFLASYPNTQLIASGEPVGLPRNEPGNTETGHLNIGAGRIVYQDLARIDMAIADGSFYTNAALLGAITHAKKNNSNLHFMGLVGAGEVHSSIEHLFALINLAEKNQVKNLYLHLFTDGRDSPPTAAKTFLTRLKQVLAKGGVGQIASVMGRYWAMDRDLRWDRTEKAYFALTKGVGYKVKTVEEAIDISYEQGKTDEFVLPSVICASNGKPIGLISDNDSVVFYNFRIDRPRQLTKAFVSKNLAKDSLEWDYDPYKVKYEKTHIGVSPTQVKVFKRGGYLNNLNFVMMTEYGRPLVSEGAKVAFPRQIVEAPLGEVLSNAGFRQLRMSESEKERFVGFYFNGQTAHPYKGEERLITPSPQVSTYDRQPEMSAKVMTEKLIEKLKQKQHKFILINFANVDMLGHTGNIGPAVKAVETVDECLGTISNYVLAYNGTLLVTADHGNAESMINVTTGEIDTEHTTNPVPFMAISKNLMGNAKMLQSGILADIAPTILSLLRIPIPSNMTGRDLLKELVLVS